MEKQVSYELQVLERGQWLTNGTYGQRRDALAEAFGPVRSRYLGVRVIEETADPAVGPGTTRTIFRDVINGAQARGPEIAAANDAAPAEPMPLHFPMEAFAAAALRLLGATVTLIGSIAGMFWLELI